MLDGKVIGYEVTDGGVGYSSIPTVTVVGAETTSVHVELSYGTHLKKNGSVKAITLVKTGAK